MSEGTQASRRRALIMIERTKTLKRMQESPWTRELLPHKILRSFPDSTLDLLSESLDGAFDSALDIATLHARSIGIDFRGDILSCFLPLEVAEAETELYDDGSALIRVSDALLSLSAHLDDYRGMWRNEAGARGMRSVMRSLRLGESAPEHLRFNHSIVAGAAAIRYYLYSQRFWGVSCAIGVKRARPTKSFPVLFILIHEIAHAILGHDLRRCGDLDTRHRWEFEADHFALMAIISHLPRFLYRKQVCAAVATAFCGLQVWSDAAFLREPGSHPGIETRWARLTPLMEEFAEAAVVETFGLQKMVGLALNFERPLGADSWRLMKDSPALNAHVQPDGHLRLSEVIDSDLNLTFDERQAALKKLLGQEHPMLTGWEFLRSGHIGRTLDAWNVDYRKIMDHESPLSYVDVVDTIRTSPNWHDTDDDAARRVFAALFINTTKSALKATDSKAGQN